MPKIVMESVRGEGYCVLCRRKIIGRHISSSLFFGDSSYGGRNCICEDCQCRMKLANEGIAQEFELTGMVDPDNPPESKPVARAPGKPGQQSLRVAL